MTEDWSCLSQQDTDPYAQICKEAVEDDNKFNLFKKFKINENPRSLIKIIFDLEFDSCINLFIKPFKDTFSSLPTLYIFFSIVLSDK